MDPMYSEWSHLPVAPHPPLLHRVELQQLSHIFMLPDALHISSSEEFLLVISVSSDVNTAVADLRPSAPQN